MSDAVILDLEVADNHHRYRNLLRRDSRSCSTLRL